MDKQVLELRQNGMGYKKIAKQLGLTLLQVSDILVAHGIIDHMKMPSHDTISRIIDWYNEGKGTQWIAKELRICTTTVRNVLKVHNIALTPKGYHQGYNNKIDHSYFDIIDSEHKAYWFGFLMADGYNNERGKNIEVTLKSEDIEHLRLLQKDLKIVSNDIKHKTIHLNGKVYEAERLTLYSKQLSDNLRDKGCVQGKSLIASFPSVDILPVELQ